MRGEGLAYAAWVATPEFTKLIECENDRNYQGPTLTAGGGEIIIEGSRTWVGMLTSAAEEPIRTLDLCAGLVCWSNANATETVGPRDYQCPG